jgi:hypothetical protein
MSSDRASKIKNVIRVASGNFLEMYDFMVFGYYAAAIGRAFFPNKDPFTSLMSALVTYGAGFVMRPNRRNCSRRLYRQSRPQSRAPADARTNVCWNAVDYRSAGLCNPGSTCATVDFDQSTNPRILGWGRARGCFSLFIRTRYARSQRLLRKLAVSKPIGCRHVRCAYGSDLERRFARGIG